MVNCKQCGGATQAKRFNGKKGPCTIFECLSGCTNEKGYPLGTFPPKNPQQNYSQPSIIPGQLAVAQKPPTQPIPETVVQLRSINQTLNQILNFLQMYNEPLEKTARKTGAVAMDLPGGNDESNA